MIIYPVLSRASRFAETARDARGEANYEYASGAITKLCVSGGGDGGGGRGDGVL